MNWKLIFRIKKIAQQLNKNKEIADRRIVIQPIAWKIEWKDEKSIPHCIMHNWKDDEGKASPAASTEKVSELPYIFDDDHRIIRFSDDESYQKAKQVLDRELK